MSYNPHGSKSVEYKKKNKNKIAVITWYNEKIKEYADKFSLINKEYCDKNNYDYIVGHKQYLSIHRAPSYNKLPFMLDILNTNKYDYVIWIDADAHFRTFNKLDKYITGEDLVFSQDIKLEDSINCGVFICKNTDYTKNFINEWINIKIKNPDPVCWEQGFLKYICENNLYEIQSHMKVVSYGELQDFNIDGDALIFHMAGGHKRNKDRLDYINSKLSIKKKIKM
tara:strand:- start:32 stop:706 length:675 start_codon:yes stop_codon:yes gene_type:complete